MLSLIFIFLGTLLLYFGCWYSFITVCSVLSIKQYRPIVLILSAVFVSLGLSILFLGVAKL